MRVNKAHIAWEGCFVEGALPEIVVADDWGSSKHCVQAPDEPKNLLWLVVGKDSKPDFDRHTFFSEGLRKIRADQTYSSSSRRYYADVARNGHSNLSKTIRSAF